MINYLTFISFIVLLAVTKTEMGALLALCFKTAGSSQPRADPQYAVKKRKHAKRDEKKLLVDTKANKSYMENSPCPTPDRRSSRGSPMTPKSGSPKPDPAIPGQQEGHFAFKPREDAQSIKRKKNAINSGKEKGILKRTMSAATPSSALCPERKELKRSGSWRKSKK